MCLPQTLQPAGKLGLLLTPSVAPHVFATAGLVLRGLPDAVYIAATPYNTGCTCDIRHAEHPMLQQQWLDVPNGSGIPHQTLTIRGRG